MVPQTIISFSSSKWSQQPVSPPPLFPPPFSKEAILPPPLPLQASPKKTLLCPFPPFRLPPGKGRVYTTLFLSPLPFSPKPVQQARRIWLSFSPPLLKKRKQRKTLPFLLFFSIFQKNGRISHSPQVFLSPGRASFPLFVEIGILFPRAFFFPPPLGAPLLPASSLWFVEGLLFFFFLFFFEMNFRYWFRLSRPPPPPAGSLFFFFFSSSWSEVRRRVGIPCSPSLFALNFSDPVGFFPAMEIPSPLLFGRTLRPFSATFFSSFSVYK